MRIQIAVGEKGKGLNACFALLTPNRLLSTELPLVKNSIELLVLNPATPFVLLHNIFPFHRKLKYEFKSLIRLTCQRKRVLPDIK
ncbi:hypothetical protein ATZ36_11885 [Candidatus Endomicrobiellum trichonymphae]|uniref:Uncharacterized protein n=1 Tax=Endomicrobium trichonymphae TaxID=1408204 RepID=A0A1E5IN48_ENDTX|nr:hypothetical protein ATZ36_11885 [Candidatus Endomicrobium trichonymphae]